MTCVEIHYDDSRPDWQEALDRQVQDALRELNFRPDVVLCFPAKPGEQLKLFKEKEDETGQIFKTRN